MSEQNERNRKRGLVPDARAIIQFRQAKSWTQDDLANSADCTTRTVRNAEKGSRIDSATMHSLAEAFGVSVSEILANNSKPGDLQSQHIEMVKSWSIAFANRDIPSVTKNHHPDFRLELPGTQELTGSEVFVGIDAVRDFLKIVFVDFHLIEVHHEEFTAVDNLVFHRPEATFRANKTGLEFTSKFLNEFEFKDEKIIRRTTISDLTGHRRGLGID